MRSASRYGWIGYTAARSNMAYRTRGPVAKTVILYIFMRLWIDSVRRVGNRPFAGLTLPQML